MWAYCGCEWLGLVNYNYCEITMICERRGSVAKEWDDMGFSNRNRDRFDSEEYNKCFKSQKL